MSAALGFHRRLALALAVCAYVAVFGAFVVLERPGLGIGHLFYLPVCLVALSTDAVVGALGGLAATVLYIVAVEAAPHVMSAPLTSSTAIRAVTYVTTGALVGWFAQRNRGLVVELQELAGTDFVTGVGNVRAFDEELSRRCRAVDPFTLVLIDVDGLRHVNDVHGHAAGDEALRQVAVAVQGCLDAGDVVARVGGDEFAVLTGRSSREVPALVHEINAALHDGGLSVTAAATRRPDDAETAAELFRKADDRLFTAKLLRANHVTLAAV